MDRPIKLMFRYSEQDFVRAMRAHLSSRLRIPLDVVMTSLLLAVGLYLWPSWYGVTLLSIAGSFIALLIALFFIVPHLIFRHEAKFRDEYELTFAEAGIHFLTVHIDSQLQWSIYSRALIDPHSYILYYGARSFTVIPKRVFQNAEDLIEFEQLLQEKIPKIVRR